MCVLVLIPREVDHLREQYDESDIKNESYICFRRRDVKAMRKTRASQQSSSEKLFRLKAELETVQNLSRSLCSRETLKRELLECGRAVWEGREEMVELKEKFRLFQKKTKT
jgi:enhancer of polycomb-like protein